MLSLRRGDSVVSYARYLHWNAPDLIDHLTSIRSLATNGKLELCDTQQHWKEESFFPSDCTDKLCQFCEVIGSSPTNLRCIVTTIVQIRAATEEMSSFRVFQPFSLRSLFGHRIINTIWIELGPGQIEMYISLLCFVLAHSASKHSATNCHLQTKILEVLYCAHRIFLPRNTWGETHSSSAKVKLYVRMWMLTEVPSSHNHWVSSRNRLIWVLKRFLAHCWTPWPRLPPSPSAIACILSWSISLSAQ